MQAQQTNDRQVIAITGTDRLDFLQGLITNDIKHRNQGLLYTALLTPQGKYLADFFLTAQDDQILLDIKSDLAAAVTQRLSMYKLRADVALTPTDIPVIRGLGDTPTGAHPDPRHPSLGWRHYGDIPHTPTDIDWNALRVAACVPETGIELIPNDTFILEAGFERLHGVDFKKGCYVGQEVTARMKHKTELRKGLTTVTVQGQAAPGTEITANGKTAGTLFTQSGEQAIAYLRFDRATGDMRAAGATVSL